MGESMYLIIRPAQTPPDRPPNLDARTSWQELSSCFNKIVVFACLHLCVFVSPGQPKVFLSQRMNLVISRTLIIEPYHSFLHDKGEAYWLLKGVPILRMMSIKSALYCRRRAAHCAFPVARINRGWLKLMWLCAPQRFLMYFSKALTLWTRETESFQRWEPRFPLNQPFILFLRVSLC